MKPLPVSGYTDQKQAKVDLVNDNKLVEELVLRQVEKHMGSQDYDPRMAALAKTKFQEGFMWLNRSVFQPTRLFGEDHDAKIAAMTEQLG